MKILLSLPEFPFAHHGGAARSMRTIAEMMVKAGHQVHCVATTATERECDTASLFPACKPEACGSELHNGIFRGVTYKVVETGGAIRNWRTPLNEATFDLWFKRGLTDFKPDIVLGYGAHSTDEARFDWAKRHGSKLVLGLRNYGYTQRSFFPRFDGVLSCSQFLTDWYRTKVKIDSTPLPLPIWPEDVIPAFQNKVFAASTFTAINPARRKGSLILETVFRVLHEKRPDIPLLIVGESSEPEFQRLKQYAEVVPWQSNPQTIYHMTKVLLVPSVWEEPAGRVIVEAMLNGIPPIITDRGGMPEVANGGAYILPLDKRVTVDTKEPVSIDVAKPWIDLISGLHTNPPNRAGRHPYEWASDRARAAAEMYLPENLTPVYEEYFTRILQGKPVAGQHVPVKSLAGLSDSQQRTAAESNEVHP